MLRMVLQSFFIALACTGVVVLSIHTGFAQVRSSSNYQLQSDSVNFGGGLSSSTNYIQESTFGEVATGISSSSNFVLKAGYQQMQEVYLSMTDAADVTMAGSLNGITGGESNGSTTVTVITDSPSGYQITISAENNPAMLRVGGSETISDYVPTNDPDADTTFTTAASDSHFGFAPTGVDIVQFFKNNGSNCNLGTETESQCWDGLSTSPITIVQGAGSNHPSGATTTVYFKVGIGGSNPVIAGEYIATTTLTAIPL